MSMAKNCFCCFQFLRALVQPVTETDEDRGALVQPVTETDEDRGALLQPVTETDEDRGALLQPVSETDEDRGALLQPVSESDEDRGALLQPVSESDEEITVKKVLPLLLDLIPKEVRSVSIYVLHDDFLRQYSLFLLTKLREQRIDFLNEFGVLLDKIIEYNVGDIMDPHQGHPENRPYNCWYSSVGSVKGWESWNHQTDEFPDDIYLFFDAPTLESLERFLLRNDIQYLSNKILRVYIRIVRENYTNLEIQPLIEEWKKMLHDEILDEFRHKIIFPS